MMSKPLRILVVNARHPEPLRAVEGSRFGPFDFVFEADGTQAEARLAAEPFDAVVFHGADENAASLVQRVAEDLAVVMVSRDRDPENLVCWLQRGIQDLLVPDELSAPAFAQRLRAAIERKRCEGESRRAYATDLGTGLPHQQQLIEHMSHLLALREREPSPMAVLVLRIEGFAATEARLGRELANVLRRKLAVRLRAGVRASDVVAALEDDAFGVLLASILSPDDAQRVGAKLLSSLHAPFKVAGHDVAVAAALGIGQYPQDGSQPASLLSKATGLAASSLAQGRVGLTHFMEAGGRSPGAANDE